MKTIGLIGGLSWYSTIEYYRAINEDVQRRIGGHASARIALQSLDFSEIRTYQETENWAAAGRRLAEAGQACQAGGADVVLICANLMHKAVDAVADAVDVPVLHIADAVVARAHAGGFSKIGLLGTRWVMEEEFYIGRLRSTGLEVAVPDGEGRELVDRVIFEELTQGVVDDRSRAAYADIIAEMAKNGAQAIVLGCTELELLVRPEDSPVPLLDSLRVHVEAAVDLALTDDAERVAVASL